MAYGLQISTFFPFFFWATKGWYAIAVVNSVCFGLGVWAFSKALPRWYTAISSSDTSGQPGTLHRYLGDYFKSHRIRKLTAVLTIISLWGVLLAELTWGAQVLVVILGGNVVLGYLLVAILLLYVLVYVSGAGHLSVLKTDRLQLAFAYFGLIIVTLYFLYAVYGVAGVSSKQSLMLVILLCVGLLMLYRRSYAALTFLENGEASELGSSSRRISLVNNYLAQIFRILLPLMMILLVIATLGVLLLKGTIPLRSDIMSLGDASPFAPRSESGELLNRFGGWDAVVAMAVLPIFIQFVDLTNWHRVKAVDVHGVDNRTGIERIRKGLKAFALEVPASWLLMFCIGGIVAMTLTVTESDNGLSALVTNLIGSHDIVKMLVGFVLVSSILAIILSTVDSCLMAIMFSWVYDVHPRTSRMLDRSSGRNYTQQRIRVLKKIGLSFVATSFALLFVFYVVFDLTGFSGENFIYVLLAFFSAQLAYSPVVVVTIVRCRDHNDHDTLLGNVRAAERVIFWGVLAGAGSGLFAGLVSLFFKPGWIWYPIPLCLVVGVLSSILAWFYLSRTGTVSRSYCRE